MTPDANRGLAAQLLIAATGAVAGWAATLSLSEHAATFAGFATGVWMLTQTALAIRRHLRGQGGSNAPFERRSHE